MGEQVVLTLPDSSERRVEAGTTARAVAAEFAPALARRAVAARLEGEIVELDRPLKSGGRLELLTEEDPDSLPVLRHSAAHALATAVRRLFPEAGIGFGPPIAEGFYYDFDVPRPFTPDDLERIEQEMRAVVAADHRFVREEVGREEARRRFAGDPLKLERLEELGDGEVISVYTSGPFVDLCRGPHLASTGLIRHFRVLHAAGAYWRGDERRQMLQRIYGTAWFAKEDLDRHLRRLEEAKRRDHRVLGRQLGLFSMQEEVGPGLVFWHPNGAMVQFLLRRFIEDEVLRRGYQLVYTPLLTREDLFRRSGHLPLYEAVQFPPMAAGEGETEGVRYRVKPMNCPMHALIYAAEQRSYRDLPVRLAEVANLYRNERSGTLHGMLRVRGLTMDDAHIFCAPEQIEDEIFAMLDLVDFVMRETFGFDYRLDLATRPLDRMGEDAAWDAAEEALAAALERRGRTYGRDRGGGAFYGPKLDVKFHDALGREWQGATIQLDFQLPERLGLEYTGADNRAHRPVMIHRAILGTMERFIGALIEQFSGAFPLWLAPEQVRVIPITDESAQQAAASHLAERLREAGLRVRLDARNETLNYRIRDAELLKVPYMAVVGAREAAAGTATVRVRGAGQKQETMTADALLARLLQEVRERRRGP